MMNLIETVAFKDQMTRSLFGSLSTPVEAHPPSMIHRANDDNFDYFFVLASLERKQSR